MAWEEEEQSLVGTVFVDRMYGERVRFLILRGPMSLCAYLGVPISHPMAGKKCSETELRCHGGLSLARVGCVGTGLAAGFYWYGWDYAHWCDANYSGFLAQDESLTKWTVAMVEEDAKAAIEEFMAQCREATR